MGLYPPSKEHSEHQDFSVANPPFKVRAAKQINTELGQNALPEGFVAMPAMSYENGNINAFSGYGCDKTNAIRSKNLLDKAFPGDMSEYEVIRKPTGIALGLPDSYMEGVKMKDMPAHIELVMCKKFENLEMDWQFSEETWHMVNEL